MRANIPTYTERNVCHNAHVHIMSCLRIPFYLLRSWGKELSASRSECGTVSSPFTRRARKSRYAPTHTHARTHTHTSLKCYLFIIKIMLYTMCDYLRLRGKPRFPIFHILFITTIKFLLIKYINAANSHLSCISNICRPLRVKYFNSRGGLCLHAP